MDKELHGELRNVVYLSTFSKVLTPGLRVGWMLAPAQIMRKVVQAKQGVDLHTGSLAQVTAYEACREGLLDRHVPFLRATYHIRRDAMIRALERYMPAGVTWTQPSGGLFTWITLPGQIDSTGLLREALVQEVAFVPGNSFYANGGGANTMRLNFSHASPEQIDGGMIRLKRAMSNLYSLT
jgi:2-aminoadipate transaminase